MRKSKIQAKITTLRNEMSEIVTLKNSLADVVSSATGMGMPGYTTEALSNIETLINNNRYSPISLNRMVLAWLYTEHGIIQTAVDQPVQDAIRGGITIKSSEMSADNIAELNDKMEAHNDLSVAVEADIWKRLFGGSGIIINQDVDCMQPFKTHKSKDLEFYACDRWELVQYSGSDDHYEFYGHPIHKSRVLKMVGKKPPSLIRSQFQGWGMSEVERMVRDLNAYLKNKDVAFELLDEAKVDLYKINGFNALVGTKDGTSKITRRIELSNMLKNFKKAVVMDTKDEWDQKTLALSGVAEMIRENRIGIASAVKIPMTKLFGISSAGFNSGEDDLENYNAMIESEIREKMKHPIKVMIGLRCIQLFGYVPDFTFEFKPLRVMGDDQEEVIRASKQNRIIALYDRGLLKSKEVGAEMKAQKLLMTETALERGELPDTASLPLGAGGQGGDENYGDIDLEQKKLPAGAGDQE